MQRQMYEITFVGRAGAALWAEFEDCEVSVGAGHDHAPYGSCLMTRLSRGSFCESLALASSEIMKVLSFCPGP